MDADDYREHLTALLPPGPAWPRQSDALGVRLLAAWADELARVDARAADLVAESLPDTCDQLLGDWERAYGLPDACLSTAATAAQRRVALLARVLDTPGQTPAYYVALAAALGLSVTLEEFQTLHTVGATVQTPLRGPAWGYAWSVTVAGTVPVYPLTVSDSVALPLATWPRQQALECLLARLKPAHTVLIMRYA